MPPRIFKGAKVRRASSLPSKEVHVELTFTEWIELKLLYSALLGSLELPLHVTFSPKK